MEFDVNNTTHEIILKNTTKERDCDTQIDVAINKGKQL